jgi:hypothetical protein
LAARSGLDRLHHPLGGYNLRCPGDIAGRSGCFSGLGGGIRGRSKDRPLTMLVRWREDYLDTYAILEYLASILTLIYVLIIVYTWAKDAIARW